jgi:predicted house-cleaning NTP pyrophosphatase (Maf/HAM1 superfamily)
VPEEINAYVEKFPVITWAGAVSPAYTYGLTLFKNVTNSPSSFTHGLPMNLLIPLLQKSGISVLPSKIKD